MTTPAQPALPPPSRADDVAMGAAIQQARLAESHGDVPVGAVVVDADGTMIGKGENRREVDQDPTAHAEVVALRDAASTTGNWHLDGCTLVVTLEPCMMCAGAIVLSRLDRVVYGAADPKAGVVASVADLLHAPFLNHRLTITSDVRGEECGRLLTDFFSARRAGRVTGRVRPPTP